MTNAKHTPGPWKACDGGTNGHYVTAPYADKPYNCIVLTPQMKGEEGAANARLIAASPVLYDYILKQAKNGCEEAKSMLALLDTTN